MNHIITFTIFIYILNIPFGFWRSATTIFSRNWYLAIHIPVPAVIMLRIYCDLGWSWQSYALMAISFFLGQLTGKLIHRYHEVQ